MTNVRAGQSPLHGELLRDGRKVFRKIGEVDIEIEFDGARPEQAAVDGAILSITNPRSEIAKGCEALAALLDSKHGRQGLKLSAAPAESQSTAAGVGEAD